MAVLAAVVLAVMGSVAQTPPSASGARQPAAGEAKVPWVPGETLTYDVTWSNLLTAGTATVTVKDRRASFGATAYYVTAEGRPSPLIAALYRVYYKADALIDTVTLLPQRASIYSDENGQRRSRVTRFDERARRIHYEVQGESGPATNQRELAVPPRTVDALTAVFRLRTVPLAAGTTHALTVAVNGHVYEVRAAVGGAERVPCGLGEVDAWRITPTIDDERDRGDARELAVWISSDARRLPVKLQGALPVGAFALTLTSARQGPVE
jgi:hypothetical protein